MPRVDIFFPKAAVTLSTSRQLAWAVEWLVLKPNGVFDNSLKAGFGGKKFFLNS